MEDSPVANGNGISVGDAVLTFLFDTTNLEQGWVKLEESNKASASRVVKSVLEAYDQLSIQGTEKLRRAADQAAAAFAKLQSSGKASMTDLLQAEQKAIEASIALKTSLGDSIPIEVTARVESLKLQYIGLTGTIEQFEAAQSASVATMERAAIAADANALAIKRQRDAELADIAAAEKEFAAINAASAAKVKDAAASEADAVSGLQLAAERAGGSIATGLGTAAAGLGPAAGVLAAVAALGEGTKKALEFENAFAELSTIIDTKSPEGAKQIALIKQQLLDLPPELGDVTELTKAMYEALSAGVPPALAVDVVAKAAVFAKGALTDVGTATKLVTAVMNNYGLSIKDVNSITAQFQVAAQDANVHGNELAQSLGRIIPVAAAMGVPLSQVLAAVGGLTHVGIDADTAVTSLRQALISIENPSKQARDRLAEVQKGTGEAAKTFADLRAEIRDKGLNVALSDLAKITRGDSDLMTELFTNVRAQLGVLSLTGENAQRYAATLRDIEDAAKKGTAAQEAMNKILASQSGELKTAANTIENDFVKGWEDLSPALAESARGLIAILVDTGLVKVAVGLLAAVLVGLSMSLGIAGIAAEGLVNAFYSIGYAATKLASVLPNTEAGAQRVAERMKTMKDGMDSSHKSIDQLRNGLNESGKALSDFLTGQGEATTKNQQYAAAAKAQALAQQEQAAAVKQANDVIQQQQREADAAKEKQEELAKAVAKTTKAMEQYANAHSIPLAEEMVKNISAARQFQEQMAATNQPIASQIAAVLNLNVQLSKLKSLMNDKRSVGQYLADISGATKKYEEDAADLPKVITDKVTNPVVDAFNTVLEAEQRLGVRGPATLAKWAQDAKEQADAVRAAFKQGLATSSDVAQADAEVERANKALADSFETTLRKSVMDALDAEKKLGIEGTQTLVQHRNDAQAAFEALKKSGVENVNQLKEAELKADEAQRDFLQAMGQPIPAALSNSIRRLTHDLEELQSRQQKGKEIDQQWYDFWHKDAPSIGDNMKDVADMGKSAFMDFTASFGNVVQQVESGQKSIGQAVEEAVAQQLIAISSQAAVQALYYTALGLANLIFDPPAAAAYFAAAAEFGAVAAVAGVAGAAMSSSSSRSNGSNGTTAQGETSGAAATVAQPTQTLNVQRFGGGALVSRPTLALIGDSRDNANKGAREGVLPLDDPKAMQQVGDAVAANMGSSGGDTHNWYVNGLVSSDTLDDVIDQVNDRVSKGKKLTASHANKLVRKS